MKAEFDKEIDALLRRSLRAAGRGAPAPPDAPHLDADVLSAFAEHALPEPARLAAVSHLADCAQCRGAVVTLSRAAGELEKRAAVPVAVDPSEAVPGGGWLAAFFSPKFLRFVAPALAVCLVGAVALVLLRARRGADTVAQHTAEPAAARPGLTGGIGGVANANASANMNTSADATANTSANVAQPPPSAEPVTAAEHDRPAPAPVAQAPDGSDQNAASGPAPALSRRQDEAAPPPPPPALAAATESVPVTAAPAQPPAARDAAKEKPEERKAQEDEQLQVDGAHQERRATRDNNNFEVQQSPDGSRNRAGNSTYGGGAARSAPASPRRDADRSSRSITRPRAGASEGAARGESESGGETRAAAGRRFRREGNAWVDVNYRSSMSMTGVRRGTDAFRALVADIPELGRVAEQLSGEVITVVRGRAYRIR